MKTDSISRVAWIGVVMAGAFLTPGLRASTVWTQWSSAAAGAPGSASGTLNGITVSFSGEVLGNSVINGTSGVWSSPASSFIGGTVTTSPSTVGDVITEDGVFTGTNTLTFSSPIVNPVFAIWSLGNPSAPAQFTFDLTPIFEAGGPDVYGGGPITVSGDVVSGREGSGVVQFTGDITSISWTDTFEYFYGFSVGEAGPSATTPEPSFAVALGAGFAGLVLMGRLRKSRRLGTAA